MPLSMIFWRGRTMEKMKSACCSISNWTGGKAQQTADFFCNAANTLSHIRFAFSYKSGKGRYILKGTEDEIRQIMQEYYSR